MTPASMTAALAKTATRGKEKTMLMNKDSDIRRNVRASESGVSR